MEEIFVMKVISKDKILLLILILLCVFLSACAPSKVISSNSINKSSDNITNQAEQSVSTKTDTTMPELNNKTAGDVPIQEIYKNQQEAANFELHMSSVDDSLNGVGDENTSNNNN